MAEVLHFDLAPGQSLEDLLFASGVEFPCGGAERCGGCKVRVISGSVPVTPEMRDVLTEREIAEGWRLGCRAQARGTVTVEIGQWHMAILSDDARLPVEPRDGLSVAVDLGTTTLVAQLLDRRSGDVLGVRTALNPQCRHGADVMTRIQFALREPGLLTALIRDGIGRLAEDLAEGREVEEVFIAGNTVMHHLFCGLDVEPLSHVPFETAGGGTRQFDARELGWTVGAAARVTFLPCLGGFVGSDILAGLVATGVPDRRAVQALVDLGTNGEIAVGNDQGIWCASTAAGPAFEAGRISMGMRAASGAIDRVAWNGAELTCHVIGGGEPRGLCGSGLVDAAAAALNGAVLTPSGRFANGRRDWLLTEPVRITQADVRELQLAKGAIAAGFEMLGARAPGGAERVWLAGAFGNYVSVESSRRIGLLPRGAHIEPAGNTSLRGVKRLLLAPSARDATIARITGLVQHVPLASDPAFQDRFVERMAFESNGVV